MNPTCECLLRIGARGGNCGKCGLPIRVREEELSREMAALARKMAAEMEPFRQELISRMKNNTADAADYALATQIRKTQLLVAGLK